MQEHRQRNCSQPSLRVLRNEKPVLKEKEFICAGLVSNKASTRCLLMFSAKHAQTPDDSALGDRLFARGNSSQR